MGERRGAHRIFVGKFEVKGPLGRSRHTWDDNIKWIFKKWDGGVDWIDLAQDRDRWRAFVNAGMNVGVR
jgi:hypothetical protein